MGAVVKPNQISLPLEVRPEEVMRKQSLGSAIELCAEVGGYALDKALQQELEVDKAQFSRWQSGTEGIVWPKFVRLMDLCGNDAPLLWMLHQRGYDLYSLRRRETETERENRLLREENAALRRVLSGATA
jgi:plasmid maintenance system antidote protein VapI